MHKTVLRKSLGVLLCTDWVLKLFSVLLDLKKCIKTASLREEIGFKFGSLQKFGKKKNEFGKEKEQIWEGKPVPFSFRLHF